MPSIRAFTIAIILLSGMLSSVTATAGAAPEEPPKWTGWTADLFAKAKAEHSLQARYENQGAITGMPTG